MTATRPHTHRAHGRAVAFRGVRVAPKVAAATGGVIVGAAGAACEDECRGGHQSGEERRA